MPHSQTSRKETQIKSTNNTVIQDVKYTYFYNQICT